MLSEMSSVAIVQPFGSHDEFLPTIYQAFSGKCSRVDLFTPVELHDRRGRIFDDLNIGANIRSFESNKRGIRALRRDLNNSDYELIIIATFSNYLRNLNKRVIRFIHNAAVEEERVKQELDSYGKRIRYLVLADFVKGALISRLPALDTGLVGVLYPHYFGELKSSSRLRGRDGKMRIGILGRVNCTRDYLRLCEHVWKEQDFFRRNEMVLEVIGDSGDIYSEVRDAVRSNHLEGIVEFAPRQDREVLQNRQMIEHIRRLNFIMPLVKARMYNSVKINASDSWAIGLAIPVLHRKLDVDESGYADIGLAYESYPTAFERLARLDEEEYAGLVRKMDAVRTRNLDKNERLVEDLLSGFLAEAG